MIRRCRVRDQAIRPPAIGLGMAQAEQRRPRSGLCHPQHRGSLIPKRFRIEFLGGRRKFITLLTGAVAVATHVEAALG